MSTEAQRQYADIEVVLSWSSEHARHEERHYYQGINLWRDYFPGMLGERLLQSEDGERVEETFAAGELVEPATRSNIVQVNKDRIRPIGRSKIMVTPRAGRFFPRSILVGTAGIIESQYQPLRIVDLNGVSMKVDLNHPLARREIKVSLSVIGERYAGKEERGGRCNDVVYDQLNGGPGMQVPAEAGSDFYDEAGFSRVDELPDTQFYQKERLIGHIDSQASAQLSAYYARYLKPGMKVLDFMASWQSHLPDMDLNVTGLGLNAREMEENPAIQNVVVQDVNADAKLPFADGEFEMVICNLSVEYLTDPLPVFAELRRITSAGGQVIMAVSDRWFPPKAIVLWSELHPYERLGLMLDYFLRTEGMVDLKTETIQGLDRPQDDIHADQRLYSDPLYIAQGTVA